MNKKDISEQTKLAFEFIQKLYFEVSYLIKEIEGLLAEEDTQFMLCRPGGYQVTSRGSSGLEPNNVFYWLPRKMAVAFTESSSPTVKGQTTTILDPNIKVIYVRIILDDKDVSEPQIHSGVLYNFIKKNDPTKWPKKFEQIMTHIEYNETKVFVNPYELDYEDGYVKFQGKLFSTNLYDINSSETLNEKIIQPTLMLYNEIQS